ncbi:hypothetical protein DSD19_04525 [Rhodovulum sp. BSW8]|nr:hypothetical protein DSD19_04525 [Rhodovulum sp. BSW8]
MGQGLWTGQGLNQNRAILEALDRGGDRQPLANSGVARSIFGPGGGSSAPAAGAGVLPDIETGEIPQDRMAARAAFNDRLRELGHPEHVIEGLGWNITDESTWDFGAHGDGGQSFGAVQWYGDRRDAYLGFAKDRGVDPTDPRAQADFADHEWRTSHADAYKAALDAGDASGAALAFLHRYEIPAKQYRDARDAAYRSRRAPAEPSAERGIIDDPAERILGAFYR